MSQECFKIIVVIPRCSHVLSNVVFWNCLILLAEACCQDFYHCFWMIVKLAKDCAVQAIQRQVTNFCRCRTVEAKCQKNMLWFHLHFSELNKHLCLWQHGPPNGVTLQTRVLLEEEKKKAGRPQKQPKKPINVSSLTDKKWR